MAQSEEVAELDDDTFTTGMRIGRQQEIVSPFHLLLKCWGQSRDNVFTRGR